MDKDQKKYWKKAQAKIFKIQELAGLAALDLVMCGRPQPVDALSRKLLDVAHQTAREARNVKD